MIGFIWTAVNEIAFITNHGLEQYQVKGIIVYNEFCLLNKNATQHLQKDKQKPNRYSLHHSMQISNTHLFLMKVFFVFKQVFPEKHSLRNQKVISLQINWFVWLVSSKSYFKYYHILIRGVTNMHDSKYNKCHKYKVTNMNIDSCP